MSKSKTKIIKTAMVSSEPYDYSKDAMASWDRGFGSQVKVFAYNKGEDSLSDASDVIEKYDEFQSQSFVILGDITAVNNNGALYFWGRRPFGEPIKPFYIITHDNAIYISASKKLIKKAVKQDCGCKVK